VDPAYHEVITRRLELPLHEGPDKTATLEEAVRRHVEAGDTLYVAAAHGRPNAAVREIARQWWGKTPGFTLAAVGVGSPWTALIHGNLVRRTITTFMGEGYPFPTPQALISRAVLDGRLELQAAIDEDVRRTVAFAKRQRTWFRSERSIDWIDAAADPLNAALPRLRAFLDA